MFKKNEIRLMLCVLAQADDSMPIERDYLKKWTTTHGHGATSSFFKSRTMDSGTVSGTDEETCRFSQERSTDSRRGTFSEKNSLL